MTGSLSQTRGRPEPGRELDALVAEKVMGWTRSIVSNFPWQLMSPDSEGAFVRSVPFYSTDIAAAFTVVDKLRSLTPQGDIHIESLNDEWSVSTCYTGEEGGWDPESWHHAASLPLAICVAALHAVAPLSPADDGGAR